MTCFYKEEELMNIQVSSQVNSFSERGYMKDEYLEVGSLKSIHNHIWAVDLYVPHEYPGNRT